VPDPPTDYVAGLPGVGQGMLDTLRALVGAPIALDTATTTSRIAGQYNSGQATLNPAFMQMMAALNPQANYYSYGFKAPAKDQPALAVAHEMLGHGLGITNEQRAEMIARSFIRLSGRNPELPMMRNPELPMMNPEETMVHARLQRMMDAMPQLFGKEKRSGR
jgi:hypothetical protein